LKDNFARKAFCAPLEAHFALQLLSDDPLDNVRAKAFAHKADIPDVEIVQSAGVGFILRVVDPG
jgi:hypothetical protein